MWQPDCFWTGHQALHFSVLVVKWYGLRLFGRGLPCGGGVWVYVHVRACLPAFLTVRWRWVFLPATSQDARRVQQQRSQM